MATKINTLLVYMNGKLITKFLATEWQLGGNGKEERERESKGKERKMRKQGMEGRE